MGISQKEIQNNGPIENITSALGDLKTSEDKGKIKETVEEAVTVRSQSLFVPPKASTFFRPLPDNFKFAKASNSSTSSKAPKSDRLDSSSLRGGKTILPEKRKSQFAAPRSVTGTTTDYQGIQTSKEGAINLYQLSPRSVAPLTQPEGR
ncbi:hypothetical protein OnM2_076018 [Erysiphe neolycopersici]|uniref:Uncharacterized protein n=1 Tax=Erysiphe neolycopersici TaxID=212602 RepID=A0A420HI59_9PEZI|nr:hypothetical protein OnM2_076018 [Erysiphe neolycopersici]